MKIDIGQIHELKAQVSRTFRFKWMAVLFKCICPKISFFQISRFNEALQTDEYSDVSPELANQFLDLSNKVVNEEDGAKSWYEISSDTHDYEECAGNHTMNWKDKGFVTLFDLLQVSLYHRKKIIEIY